MTDIKYFSNISVIFIILCFLNTANINAQKQNRSDRQNIFNVLDYGAFRDGKTKNTEAIKKAIDAAAAEGGGTVYFPGGIYLTGPIHFKSNITLDLASGAVIKFSDDYEDYLPMVKVRWEGTVCMNFSPQLYAYKVNNIAIKGRGIIDGQGKKWWYKINMLRKEDKKGEKVDWGKYQEMSKQINKDVKAPDDENWNSLHFFRPQMFQSYECKNVLIEGVTMMNPPFWTINPAFCEDVTIEGITINNPYDSPNTDGIDPTSCNYLHIADCYLHTGDDCIAIKSGRDEDGRAFATPCQNITITNCTMLEGHGGVVIGSEMSGDVRKVAISNCVFDGTDRGIRIKTMRGRGGVIEEVRVDNIVMKNIKKEAITLNMEYKKTKEEPLSDRTPRFRNIHFSNITGTNVKQAGNILGLNEMWVDNVSFNDINISGETGFGIKKAKNVALHNVTVNVKKGPVIFADNVENLELDGIRTLQPNPDKPLIDLNNVDNAYIYNCDPLPGTGQFLKVDGSKSKFIVLGSNNLIHVKQDIVKGKSLTNGAVVK